MKAMPFALRTPYHWKLRTRSLLLGPTTLVMGILNVTPDSFSDGGAFAMPSEAIEAALAMFDEGADIVDIGGESTRPGKRDPVSAQQEMDRVLPVLEGIRSHRPESILSIDTYKSTTAAAVLKAGAEIINDVSGLQWDGAMAKVCALSGCGVVLMHTRGRPEDWHALGPLEPHQVTNQVKAELGDRLNQALQAGIERERIVLDPGFGFGKAGNQNYELLARLEDLSTLCRPLLAGVSRKSFLGGTVDHRETASLAAAVAALLAGAHLIRVHNVRPSREAAAVADALLAASIPSSS
jgi:dihydropteroate synthase